MTRKESWSHLLAEHGQTNWNGIVGEEFVATKDQPMLAVTYGRTGYGLLRLRHKQLENVPDAAVCPDTAGQVERIVGYAVQHKIFLYVYGGGSSVTRGMEAFNPGLYHPHK